MTKQLITFLLFCLVLNCSGQVTPKDSTKKLISFNGGFVEGTYEYGLLPFYGNIEVPDQNIRGFGNARVAIKDIPLVLSFLYNSNPANVGVNNYFNVEFDIETYKQNQLDRINKFKQFSIDSLNKLNDAQTDITKKLKYLELINLGEIAFPLDSSELVDNLLGSHGFEWLDTLGTDTITAPGLPIQQLPIDSSKLDSLQTQLAQTIQSLQSKQNELDSLRNLMQLYSTISPDSLIQSKSKLPDSKLSKLQSFMRLVDKFQIGLCYPNYSKFLIYQAPLKGVNVEISDKNYFVGFSYGIIQPNIFYTNNLLNNTVNSLQNAYNFFDFNNTDVGRRVLSTKFGYGSKDGNHLHFGLLHGVGNTSYYDTLLSSKENNAVIEIDGKYIFKSYEIQLIYGRSHVQSELLSGTSNGVWSNLMEFKDRSNALYSSLSKGFDKINLYVSGEFRFIEPLFESFGVGFMRSDNLRYQIKIDKGLGKKGKASLFYRKEKDNILNWFDFENSVNSWGVSLAYRISKSIRARIDYRPLEFTSEIADSSFDNRSKILNGIISCNKRIGDSRYVGNVLASYYDFYTLESNLKYYNVGVQNSLFIGAKFQLEASYNYFATNDTSGIPESHLITLGSTYLGKVISATINADYSSAAFGNGFGGGVKFSARFLKRMVCSIEARRIVPGSFYTSYYNQAILEFPYYSNCSLRIEL